MFEKVRKLLGRGSKEESRLMSKAVKPKTGLEAPGTEAMFRELKAKAGKTKKAVVVVELLGGDKLATLRAHLAKYKQAGVVVHPSGKLVVVSPNHAAWLALNPYNKKLTEKPKPAKVEKPAVVPATKVVAAVVPATKVVEAKPKV